MNAKRTSSAVVTALALATMCSQAKADDRNPFVATFSGFQELGRFEFKHLAIAHSLRETACSGRDHGVFLQQS